MKPDENVVNRDAEKLKKIYLTAEWREPKLHGTESPEITFLASESIGRYLSLLHQKQQRFIFIKCKKSL